MHHLLTMFPNISHPLHLPISASSVKCLFPSSSSTILARLHPAYQSHCASTTNPKDHRYPS